MKHVHAGRVSTGEMIVGKGETRKEAVLDWFDGVLDMIAPRMDGTKKNPIKIEALPEVYLLPKGMTFEEVEWEDGKPKLPTGTYQPGWNHVRKYGDILIAATP